MMPIMVPDLTYDALFMSSNILKSILICFQFYKFKCNIEGLVTIRLTNVLLLFFFKSMLNSIDFFSK